MANDQKLPNLVGASGGYRRCRDKNKPRIHIQSEVTRLYENFNQEDLQIKPQARQEYEPYIFNGLGPYRDMHTLKFLVDLPDDVSRSYHIRQLATGLCDPWTNLNMDKEHLPEIRNRALTAPATHKPKRCPDRPPKEGSTMLPKFPVVSLLGQELNNKTLFYSDVPRLRKQLRKLRAHDDAAKKQADYTRTVQDFYRMDLDRFDQFHRSNRSRMIQTYHAYLQNTPGSRKAINHCINRSLPSTPRRRAAKGNSQNQN